jgi:hypothetical protein
MRENMKSRNIKRDSTTCEKKREKKEIKSKVNEEKELNKKGKEEHKE